MTGTTGEPVAVRLAVIDADTGFLTVLARRLAAVGWQHRVLFGIGYRFAAEPIGSVPDGPVAAVEEVAASGEAPDAARAEDAPASVVAAPG